MTAGGLPSSTREPRDGSIGNQVERVLRYDGVRKSKLRSESNTAKRVCKFYLVTVI